MLEYARHAARDADMSNVTWVLGADTDVPALHRLLGDRSVGAVTRAQALYWMNNRDLFQAVVPLLRLGGGIAVVTNATPLWLEQTDWSQERDFLEHWLGTKLAQTCGADEQSQHRYPARGSRSPPRRVDYVASLDTDQLVGSTPTR
jgi:hypothetical protein